MKKWLDHRGIASRDLFYMLISMVPLTIFVGIMLYGLIGTLLQ